MKLLASKLAITFVVAGAICFVMSGRAHAATLNVVADGIPSTNGQCQFNEAIININDQAQTHADCPAGDGNNDTIILPTATLKLNDAVPELSRSMKIQGQGVAQTIISGEGQYDGLFLNGTQASDNDSITISNLTLRSIVGVALNTSNTLKTANIENIEINGTNSSLSNAAGGGINATSENLTVNNVYIHNFTASGEGNNLFGMNVLAFGGQSVTATVNNVTIRDLNGTDLSSVGGISAATGLADGQLVASNLDLTVNNATIDNLSNSGQGNLVYIGGLAAVNDGDSVVNLKVNNATLRNVNDIGSNAYAGGLAMTGIAIGEGDNATFNIDNRNVLLVGFNGKACTRLADAASILGAPASAGTISLNHTSNGGNVAEDNSCAPDHNQNSDKNNVTGLKDTLNTIANNGGSLPTILPKPGSLAIDGGVCGQGVLTTDARGVARPQGATCDSGAVEVVQNSVASTGGLSTAAGGSKVYLNLPAGAVAAASSVSTATKADSGYSYPFGLVGFTLNVPSGSTQTVSLDFETTLALGELKARKFIASTNTYQDIPGVSLTEATRNGKRFVRMTYAITDGGALDADGQANGVIVDPVGLAQVATLPRVGLLFTGLPLLLAMVVTASYVVIDWRRHLKPLREEDPDVHYTLWHHIRVVTIPLFHYRLSVVVSRPERV